MQHANHAAEHARDANLPKSAKETNATARRLLHLLQIERNTRYEHDRAGRPDHTITRLQTQIVPWVACLPDAREGRKKDRGAANDLPCPPQVMIFVQDVVRARSLQIAKPEPLQALDLIHMFSNSR